MLAVLVVFQRLKVLVAFLLENRQKGKIDNSGSVRAERGQGLSQGLALTAIVERKMSLREILRGS